MARTQLQKLEKGSQRARELESLVNRQCGQIAKMAGEGQMEAGVSMFGMQLDLCHKYLDNQGAFEEEKKSGQDSTEKSFKI